jgi:pimeloyl-ACP methyl ester carboxylesterase
MPEIVFVHGIANEQFSADRLEEEWRPQLAGGLRASGHNDLADRVVRDRSLPGAIDCRMAFYGNMFLKPGAQGGSGGWQSAEEEQMAEALAMDWLENIATRASNAQDQADATRALAAAQPAGEGAQGLGHATGVVFNAVSRVPFFAQGVFGAAAFVNGALKQVVRYLEDPKIRPAARRTVLDLLGPETRILIAHSLGSVVAWEALHYAPHQVRLFLTIGSPLGLRRIVYPKLWPQPPVYPKRADRWVNVADRNDFIAAETHLESMFPGGNGRFVGTWTVDNGSSPHNAQFYLGKEEIGDEIAAALS